MADIKAVVFDIGGVLELTHDGREPTVGLGRLFTTWNDVLELEPDKLLQAVRQISVAGLTGQVTEEQWWGTLADSIDRSLDELDDLREAFWVEYLGILNFELLHYFDRLRPRVRTAMLSNSFVGARERERDAYSFEGHTEFIVYSHEVGMKKPDVEIYELTCERLALAPREVLFLDDLESYIAGANRAGLRTVKFENTAQAIRDIDAMLGLS